jgi:hypothetical protein
MNASEQILMEKIRQLPPQGVAEVEDFVEFLRLRSTERALVQAAAQTAAPSFAAVWDNDDDAAYDSL